MIETYTIFWITCFLIILNILPITSYSNYFKPLMILGIVVGISIILFPVKIQTIYGILLILLSIASGYRNSNILQTNKIDNYEGLLHKFLVKKERFRLIPIFGFILLLIHSVLIMFYFNNRLGTIDRLIIIQAFTWILYNYVNTEYYKEKDFLFIFLNLISIFFILPALIISFFGSDNTSSSGDWAPFVNILLAKPLGLFLNKIGYVIIVDNDSILYQDTVSGVTTRLWIAKSCSGINSVLIFLSGYISYLLSKELWNRYFFVLLIMGILFSYLANLLRMSIIVIVGHHYGIDALLWTHDNAGWMIFTFWIFIFWQISVYVEDEIGKSNILSP